MYFLKLNFMYEQFRFLKSFLFKILQLYELVSFITTYVQ